MRNVSHRTIRSSLIGPATVAPSSRRIRSLYPACCSAQRLSRKSAAKNQYQLRNVYLN